MYFLKLLGKNSRIIELIQALIFMVIRGSGECSICRITNNRMDFFIKMPHFLSTFVSQYCEAFVCVFIT